MHEAFTNSLAQENAKFGNTVEHRVAGLRRHRHGHGRSPRKCARRSRRSDPWAALGLSGRDCVRVGFFHADEAAWITGLENFRSMSGQ
jgi:hypothetical protein